MSVTSLENTNRVAIPCYDDLFRKVFNTFNIHAKIYGKEDYRCVFYGTYCETLLWTLVQLENLSNHNPKPIISKRFKNLTPSSRAQILLQYDTINRQAFVSVTMAQVEDFINALCQELFGKSFTYYAISIKKLCNKIFPQKPSKYYSLYALYLIRNSMHNNGYIKILKDDFDLQIGSTIYKFRKGEQISFAGWDNICIITGELLNIINETIENKNIHSISRINHTHVYESDTGVLLNK